MTLQKGSSASHSLCEVPFATYFNDTLELLMERGTVQMEDWHLDTLSCSYVCALGTHSPAAPFSCSTNEVTDPLVDDFK